ncbi:hypothetical protein IscW_ISCW011690 [Ixodes scapularis]|uniref:Uncharacterized protein n=1 Tax=Ixodes scapularis TaxID=6945 RepID=B7Q6Y8_IXOSC|nr:hypothetical protein IscW_ISCW011690 [Ixodes scapularis]|eukprot:XP_002412055.1 hypothetical protein IscW_ISCW011690 [Ixodes scapularis]
MSAAASAAVKHAFVFLPTCRRNVKEFTAKQLQQAVAQAGIAKTEEVAVKFNAKASTAEAIMTDPDTAQVRFLENRKPERPMKFQTINTQERNYCKELACFKLDPCETNNFLKTGL